MPSRTRTSRRSESVSAPSEIISSERELIVVAKPEAGLRASNEMVASIMGEDVSTLNSVLSESGAKLIPVFGPEERVAIAMSSAMAARADALSETGLPDMTTFYRVVAEDENLDDLASRLIETDVVEAAYVKPAPLPPTMFEQPIMPPNPADAPPVTPNFVARQIYLNAAPAGIDAVFAATVPGGKGQGVRIIDIEGGWNFNHKDLSSEPGWCDWRNAIDPSPLASSRHCGRGRVWR